MKRLRALGAREVEWLVAARRTVCVRRARSWCSSRIDGTRSCSFSTHVAVMRNGELGRRGGHPDDV